jgi:mono/diheme cytochrome c family protein
MSSTARRIGFCGSALAFGLSLACGSAAIADDGSDARSGADALRSLIEEQVGGLKNLQVPARNADLPLPRAADGSVPYRYEYTEVKRYLGKLLFHDPIRTQRIDINGGADGNPGQPKNLPAGTSFGGTIDATDPLIQRIFPETTNANSTDVANIVAATKATGSCGACHIGEAAGKAGQQLNFNVGGEGRGYTDENGRFVPRRRPLPVLAKLRTTPLFQGDDLVDALPTLTDIWVDHGTDVITTPAFFYHYPNPPGTLNPPAAAADPNLQLLATGRLDQLDSVGRMSPSMVGFAFNNRLLLGGFAGEPQLIPGTSNANLGSLNPNSDPAQENLTLLLLDAHRMINFQSAALQGSAAFVKLFTEAFPQEAAAAAATGHPEAVISDDTVLRATSTFLRTVVTRNTPFDRFLAGDDHALTSAQRRGGRLFFTPAAAGGAGCFSCHSGPMLNKQPNDPDVTGVGAFVEQNFVNVGIGDHPVQALNALARGHLNAGTLGSDGFPYHAEDNGRQEVTRAPQNADAFKFRVLTLRQLKDGRNFMHNGSFTRVRDVVEYFNGGVPQDPTAAAAGTLSARFTNPRGAGYPTGLGLSAEQVDDLTDFLENALYDPALVQYDPDSSTDTLQPNPRDLTYSKYHPELAAFHVRDGVMLSGEAIDDNDPLTRRDEGIDPPIDVTAAVSIALIGRDVQAGRQIDRYSITNSSTAVIDTNLLVLAEGLPNGVQLIGPHTAVSSGGAPYLRVFLTNGVLNPGESTVLTLRFHLSGGPAPVGYRLDLRSGQGNP